MSALGITFVALCLSWLIGTITRNLNHPVLKWVYIISTLLSFSAMVTGIVLLGMKL